MEEKELIRKLVFSGHLNVPERSRLPDKQAKSSLIYLVIEERLLSGEPFHVWWLPDDSMIGCAIMYRGDGPGRIGWTYSGIEGELSGVREYATQNDALDSITSEARRFWGNAIDGVPINWDH